MKSSAQQRSSATPARIHLRVKHPKLAPKEITRVLSMTPEHTLEAGRHAAAMSAECYWIAPLTFSPFGESSFPFGESGSNLGEPERRETAHREASAVQMMDDETVIGLAVRSLQPHQRFFRTLADDGGTATLLISVNTTGSMTIPPTLARKLADLGLALEVDWSEGE